MAKLDAAALAGFYADYVDRWNRRDLERYYALYAEDLVFRDSSAVLHGLDPLRDRYEAELREYPDLTIECLRLFVDVESQALAAENVERGTGIELRGALFLTLDAEGRISEIAEYLVFVKPPVTGSTQSASRRSIRSTSKGGEEGAHAS